MRGDHPRVDKLGAIRTILDSFVRNIDNHNIRELVTVDKMLYTFRGQCLFVQFIPSKPVKYGIKMFATCSTITFYCRNSEVYYGMQPL